MKVCRPLGQRVVIQSVSNVSFLLHKHVKQIREILCSSFESKDIVGLGSFIACINYNTCTVVVCVCV